MSFSSGEKERILFARELYKKPSFLIIDEAFSSIDKKTRDKILDYCYEKKIGLIIISHYNEISANVREVKIIILIKMKKYSSKRGVKMLVQPIDPKIITVVTTYKCTAACRECCFQCSPKINVRLTYEEINRFITTAVREFKDSIQLCVFTGGECTLLGGGFI